MGMPGTGEGLIHLHNELDTQKSTFSDFWQDVTDYVMPTKHNVNRFESPGMRRGFKRYDSTAVHAAELLAASMSGTLTSPALQWFFLKLRDEKLNEDPEVKSWLERSQKRMYAAFASSNFYQAIDGAYLDLIGYGTNAFFTQSKGPGVAGGFKGLHFGGWPIRDFVIQENDEGLVDTVARKWTMTAMQAATFFAKKPGATLPKAVNDALTSNDKKNLFKDFTFLHWIHPRGDKEPRRMAAEMPFASVYVGVDDRSVIHKSGFLESPVAVARWRKANDDRGWGRGPALTAMPDVKTINETKRLGLKALAKDIDPPILIPHKGVIGSVRMNPSGITYYKQGVQPPSAFQTGGNKQYEQLKVEELKQAIRSMFFADQLQLQEGPAMTATEAQIRFELMQRLLGPTLGFITRELLDAVIFRSFNVMLREGGLERPPQKVIDASRTTGEGLHLDVDYIGPLAKAQKTQDLASIERTYQIAGGIAAAKGDPSVFDNLDDDEAVRHGADLVGLPSKILKDRDAVQDVREARQQAQEAQAGLDQAGQVADIAQKSGADLTQVA